MMFLGLFMVFENALRRSILLISCWQLTIGFPKASSFGVLLCRFQRHNEMHTGRSTRPPGLVCIG